MRRRLPPSTNDVHVHGTYIHDLGYGRIRFVEDLTRDQAAELVNMHHELRQQEYMWLNKGWIVERLGYRIGPTVSDETFVGGPEGAEVTGYNPKLVPGDMIVYLHDGQYRRYEYVGLAGLAK